VSSSNNGPPPPASKTGAEDNRPVELILASWADRFVASPHLFKKIAISGICEY